MYVIVSSTLLYIYMYVYSLFGLHVKEFVPGVLKVVILPLSTPSNP